MAKRYLRCSRCDAWVEDSKEKWPNGPLMPKRHACGGYLRSDVVSYGTELGSPTQETADAQI